MLEFYINRFFFQSLLQETFELFFRYYFLKAVVYCWSSLCVFDGCGFSNSRSTNVVGVMFWKRKYNNESNSKLNIFLRIFIVGVGTPLPLFNQFCFPILQNKWHYQGIYPILFSQKERTLLVCGNSWLGFVYKVIIVCGRFWRMDDRSLHRPLQKEVGLWRFRERIPLQ